MSNLIEVQFSPTNLQVYPVGLGITASLYGTASYSVTASYAMNGGSGGGSSVSSSWASQSLSASYALSASWTPSPHVEKGLISASSFSGTPQTFTVNYTQPFINTIYVVSVIGEDARLWSSEARTTTSFVISTNSNQSLTGMVSYRVEQI